MSEIISAFVGTTAHRDQKTLGEDFQWWWNLAKYKKRDIAAREYSDELIKERHGSNKGWPGEDKKVMYWVELWNGVCVGMVEPRTASGRRAKYAEFPVVEKG